MLNPEYEWGQKITTAANPIKLRLLTAFDRTITRMTYEPVTVPVAEGFQTDKNVVLHPRFGFYTTGHWHDVPAVGRQVLLRQYDILHVQNAEGKVTERIAIAIFPKPVEQNSLPDNIPSNTNA